MTMKVGVQGRVLLGPAGGPGRVDVPLRVAVVEEGTNPKPIVSKLYRLAVDVPPGQTTVPFVHVEQDLTFPMPRAAALDNYVVYVGFDPRPRRRSPSASRSGSSSLHRPRKPRRRSGCAQDERDQEDPETSLRSSPRKREPSRDKAKAGASCSGFPLARE